MRRILKIRTAAGEQDIRCSLCNGNFYENVPHINCADMAGSRCRSIQQAIQQANESFLSVHAAKKISERIAKDCGVADGDTATDTQLNFGED